MSCCVKAEASLGHVMLWNVCFPQAGNILSHAAQPSSSSTVWGSATVRRALTSRLERMLWFEVNLLPHELDESGLAVGLHSASVTTSIELTAFQLAG
ncbi:unnamed protein product [Arctogadus glacialis]